MDQLCYYESQMNEKDLIFDSVKNVGNPKDRKITLYFTLKNGQRQSLQKTISWIILRPGILACVKSKILEFEWPCPISPRFQIFRWSENFLPVIGQVSLG